MSLRCLPGPIEKWLPMTWLFRMPFRGFGNFMYIVYIVVRIGQRRISRACNGGARFNPSNL
jgi:hypothetical protein